MADSSSTFSVQVSPSMTPTGEPYWDSFLRQNASWFVQVRWFVVGLAVMGGLVGYGWGIFSNNLVGEISAGILLLIGFNAGLQFYLGRAGRIGNHHLLVQVLGDLVLLTYFCVLSGSIGSPLVPLYLLHVFLAGVILPGSYLVGTAGIVSGLVGLLYGLNMYWSLYVESAFLSEGLFWVGPRTASVLLFIYLGLVLVITLLLRKILGNLRLVQERLQHRARYDSITGCYNRDTMERKLQRLFRQSGGNHAVVGLDILQFQRINQAHGYQFGDQVLAYLAGELRTYFDSDTLLSRWGGDEFVLLFPDLEDVDELKVKLQGLLNQYEHPVKVGGREIRLSLNLGVSRYPEHGQQPSLLVSRAFQAVQHTREISGGSFDLFEPGSGGNAGSDLELENDLTRALDQQQVTTAFQPIVSAEEKIRGFEVLARWEHPDQGTISPGRFIPLAETTGLIHRLGEQVFQQVDQTCRSYSNDEVLWWVNVSGLQLANEELISRLKDGSVDLPRLFDRVVVELTETSLMEEVQEADRALADLREMGFKVAVDDFGTGYSSLSYLANLPVDVIKLDRSLITGLPGDPFQERLLRLIHGITDPLEADLLVEGIETEEQWDVIRPFVDYAQGFYFGRPAPEPTYEPRE